MNKSLLLKNIKDAIKAPLRSSISTPDLQVMGISSTKMSEIMYDVDKVVTKYANQQELKFLKELEAIPGVSTQEWSVLAYQKLLERIAELEKEKS